jgi:NACHT domain
MPDPITAITAITAFIAANAPYWLNALQSTLLNSSSEIALQKGTNFVHDKLHLDKKEQLRHLEAALKHALEAGQTRFQTPAERAQYCAILANLSAPGVHSDTLRREVSRLFTLSEMPNLAELNTLYNRSLYASYPERSIPPAEVDSAPYLIAFFNALIEALYVDEIFKPQMSDVLHLRIAQSMQSSLTEVSSTLSQIDGKLADHYTKEHFERDIATYTAYMERTLHYLKLVGVMPKDRSGEHTDPELNAIFVPLRLAPEDTKTRDNKMPVSIIGWLEQSSNVVLLGGPGSGKSTATRYLSWSHAAVHLMPPLISPSSVPLLSGRPFPLRIELRRLSEERRQQPNLDFLDYAVRILLGRAGSHIKRQMFIELLTQRQMLCLFDGLDEVASLDERRRFIDEIEDFVQCYPGNRILVTSRPVGYDLARFSNQLFTHTSIEEFDNQQIGTFLEHWYMHVLRLSPLPPDDRQELETLYTMLKDNPRLHALAANPLLLTVITALHRYERLPDRRILVYDRCADLLLDTWAKLKGTDIRWKDMKIGKEDQYACVAHLGFVLHEGSQEKREESTTSLQKSTATDGASDVPTRFMLKEIEHFLKDRRLLSEVAEQRAEAKRFLDLMQIEAGLIVERGKGENGEDLYGFVHRTFQEYFAAADVYERYLQEEDSTIISDFLYEHLHDPHWHETILLLLAKLKRKPATVQLRQVLKHKSRLGQHVDILHHDLFFACTCLAEDIAIDMELAESIVSHISDLVKQSPFPSQRKKALDSLASLLRTRQYAHLGLEELRTFSTQDVLSDPIARVHAVQLFYKNYIRESPEQREATQKLVEMMQREDLTIEQSIEAALALYMSSSSGSYEQRQATKKLVEMVQSEDLTIKQTIEVAEQLYMSSFSESQERQVVIQKLRSILQRGDLTIEQTIKAAEMLYYYHYNSSESQEHQFAVQKLRETIQREDLTIEQTIEAAGIFYNYSSSGSQERQVVVQKLRGMLQREDLTIEQITRTANVLYWSSSSESQEHQVAVQKLREILQREDLTIEQTIEMAKAFYSIRLSGSQQQQAVIQKLREILQREDLTIEQTIKVTEQLYKSNHFGSQQHQVATQKLREILQREDLTIEQTIEVAKLLYTNSLHKSQEEQDTRKKLIEAMQSGHLTTGQTSHVLSTLYQFGSSEDQEQQKALQNLIEFILCPKISFDTFMRISQIYSKDFLSKLLSQFQRSRSQSLVQFQRSQQYHLLILKLNNVAISTDLSIEQTIEAIKSFYLNCCFPSYEWWISCHMIMDFLRRTDISIEHRIKMIQVFFKARTLYTAEMDQMTEMFLELLLYPDISLDQSMEIAEFLSTRTRITNTYLIDRMVNLVQEMKLPTEIIINFSQAIYAIKDASKQHKEQATRKLMELVDCVDLSIEQRIDAAYALYQSSLDESQEQQKATQKLVTLVGSADLSLEQHVQAIHALYCSCHLGSLERQQTIQQLWQQTQDLQLSLDQRLKSALVPLAVQDANYIDRVQAIQIVFTLTDREIAALQIKKRWHTVDSNNKAQATDIPSLLSLINDERLPIEIRDEVYQTLESLIPEFGNLSDL